jgi:hypothetical protein
MLVVEIDELELFEKMLKKGGDVDKTYSSPKNLLQQINCQKIAEFFKSEKILKRLNKC